MLDEPGTKAGQAPNRLAPDLQLALVRQSDGRSGHGLAPWSGLGKRPDVISAIGAADAIEVLSDDRDFVLMMVRTSACAKPDAHPPRADTKKTQTPAEDFTRRRCLSYAGGGSLAEQRRLAR